MQTNFKYLFTQMFSTSFDLTASLCDVTELNFYLKMLCKYPMASTDTNRNRIVLALLKQCGCLLSLGTKAEDQTRKGEMAEWLKAVDC